MFQKNHVWTYQKSNNTFSKAPHEFDKINWQIIYQLLMHWSQAYNGPQAKQILQLLFKYKNLILQLWFSITDIWYSWSNISYPRGDNKKLSILSSLLESLTSDGWGGKKNLQQQKGWKKVDWSMTLLLELLRQTSSKRIDMNNCIFYIEIP